MASPRSDKSQAWRHAGVTLRAEILRAIAEQGYDTPTPIQAQAIPVVLEGRDLMAAAQTGTGKTAGFTLPILQLLSARDSGLSLKRFKPRCLVLVPTRELAVQVHDSVRTYGRHLRLKSAAIYGGVGLVLDEADRMLDMGFIRDIRRIIALLPKKKQSLLFSATFSDEIRGLATGLLNDPVGVEVARRNAPAELVSQTVYQVDRDRKRDLLIQLIDDHGWHQVLVFTRTKHGADALSDRLAKAGIRSAALHGNKSQNQRQRALDDFKRLKLNVLVATDIAARGIDIDELPHVVNYELPNVPEDYVHRIGRTGRAGSSGQAVSLVCVDEHKLLRDIESLLKRAIEKKVQPGFEPDPSIKPQPIQKPRGNVANGTQGARQSQPSRHAPSAPRGKPGAGRNTNGRASTAGHHSGQRHR